MLKSGMLGMHHVYLSTPASSSGHVASWGKGHPELLTPCFDPQGQPTGQLGPLCPCQLLPLLLQVMWHPGAKGILSC